MYCYGSQSVAASTFEQFVLFETSVRVVQYLGIRKVLKRLTSLVQGMFSWASNDLLSIGTTGEFIRLTEPAYHKHYVNTAVL